MTTSSPDSPIELLRLSTAGSVDDGKSTLIGRLLYDTKSLFEDQIEQVEAASRKRGDASTDLSLFTDGLRAEREQKITIDVAYRFFSTPRRKFIIADTPGHVQYTRNMVTGASTAELAVILVDARKGILTQSKRHSFLAVLLQIPHIVVAINKMDLVDYDEGVYQQISKEYQAFAERLEIEHATFIPMSALHGDNVVEESENTPWYNGPTLLEHLEQVDVGSSRNLTDFRYPVQYVVRPDQDFRGFAGQVASGRTRPGEPVVVFPSGLRSSVAEISSYDGPREEAIAGDSVVLTLEDEIDVSRGDMIVHADNLPHESQHLDVTLCWMNEARLDPSASYWLHHTTSRVRVLIDDLDYKIDVDTMTRAAAETLEVNEIGRARLTTTKPLFFDTYARNRTTGSFILVDTHTNATVAAGMIRGPAHRVDGILEEQSAESPTRRSTHIQWEGGRLSREQREELNGHRAAVIWFTGRSGAGKSTIAQLMEVALHEKGTHSMYLDSDDRQEHVRRLADVAALGYRHGNVVLCSSTSPFASDREFARGLVDDERFIEVHVRCEPEVLEQRARDMGLEHFTGASAPYEAPEAPELVVDTDEETPDDIVARIIAALEERELV